MSASACIIVGIVSTGTCQPICWHGVEEIQLKQCCCALPRHCYCGWLFLRRMLFKSKKKVFKEWHLSNRRTGKCCIVLFAPVMQRPFFFSFENIQMVFLFQDINLHLHQGLLYGGFGCSGGRNQLPQRRKATWPSEQRGGVIVHCASTEQR